MSVHSSAGCYLLLVAMVSLVISTVDVASAKRGCASFGHSCFGGHGKRSSPSEDPEAPPTGEDYFLAPALPPLSYPYPGKAPRSLDYEMTLDPARAANMAPFMSYLTGGRQREEWARPQQPAVLISSADLSPFFRQMMKSYRQHQMKSTK